jgi:hypothetical protein
MLHQVGPCNLSLRITRRIVARLSLQILEILKQCNVSKDIQDKVGYRGVTRTLSAATPPNLRWNRCNR